MTSLMLVLMVILLSKADSVCIDTSALTRDDVHLENSLYSVSLASSILDCAADCSSSPDCLSFGFEPATRTCHQHLLNSVTATNEMKEKKNWLHSDIASWPKTMLGPCSDHNCNKGDKCMIHRVTMAPVCVKVSEWETSVNEVKGSEDALVDNVATSSINTLKGNMETSVNEVTASQGALVDDVATLKSSVTALKGDMETSVNEVKGPQSALVKDVATLQSSVTTLKRDIKEDACPVNKGYLFNSKLSLCYKLYKVALSRDDANTRCKGDTGLLISLETQEKYNHIVGYLNSLGKDAYIKGLNRYQLWNGLLSVNRGKWIWANGKTTLPRWAPGEPNRMSNRDCGQILAGGNGDIVCDMAVLPFMCEILL